MPIGLQTATAGCGIVDALSTGSCLGWGGSMCSLSHPIHSHAPYMCLQGMYLPSTSVMHGRVALSQCGTGAAPRKRCPVSISELTGHGST